MKIIKTSNYNKISQSNQFGNQEPKRSNDYHKDQTTKEKTDKKVKEKKKKKEIYIKPFPR